MKDMKMPKPVNVIKVIALRVGWFGNRRKKVGDEFEISKESQLGTWMKCVNPDLQEAHLKRCMAKKAGRKQAVK